jgi:hypothetical protein
MPLCKLLFQQLQYLDLFVAFVFIAVCLMVFNAIFNKISVISWRSVFIDGGNRRNPRKPPTCRKSLTNFIAWCCTPRPDRDSNGQKEKQKRDRQRSTKHSYKTKDRVTRTPLKTGRELRCSRRVGSSCSTSETRRVNLVTNPVISLEWGNDREVLATSGTYPWSFVTQIFHNGQPSHGGDRKTFEVMISTYKGEHLVQ